MKYESREQIVHAVGVELGADELAEEGQEVAAADYEARAQLGPGRPARDQAGDVLGRHAGLGRDVLLKAPGQLGVDQELQRVVLMGGAPIRRFGLPGPEAERGDPG